MDCRDIRDALVHGPAPAGAEVVAHTARCPACRTLLASGGVSNALEVEARSPVTDVEPLFAKIQSDIAREVGPRAWLRSRPTWLRRAFVLASGAPLALVVLGLVGFRKDLALFATERLALDLGLLGALILANVWTALRPVQESPRPLWQLVVLGLGSALLGVIWILLPAGHVCVPTLADGPGAPASLCYAVGMNLGLPVALAAWLVGRQSSSWRTLLAAAAAALTGILVLHLNCPSHVREHLLLGHATIAATFLAVAGVAALTRGSVRWLARTFLIAGGTALFALTSFTVLSRVTDHASESAGVNVAKSLAYEIGTLRKVYNEDVVTHAESAGLSVDYDFDRRERTVPLPATLVKSIGARLAEDFPGASVKLYSRFPFPGREPAKPLDDFQRAALETLERDPARPVHALETIDGRLSVRYAKADVMRESCVACHNSRSDSPKRDWRVGEVRGVLEIVVPVDGVAADFRHTLAVVGGLVGGALLLLGAIVLGTAATKSTASG
jgi:hypothetical protein